MKTQAVTRASFLSLAIILACAATWGGFWRSQGFVPSPEDDKLDWLENPREVYQPVDSATVFIGAPHSRATIDQQAWRQLTGERVVPLARAGTSPLQVLRDLAADPYFNGKLIVAVTEPLFFRDHQLAGQPYGPDPVLVGSEARRRPTGMSTTPPASGSAVPLTGEALTSVLDDIRLAVQRIRSRGGRVCFVQVPATSARDAAAARNFPREQYWDRLLEHTGAPGIHYYDSPATSRYAHGERPPLSAAGARDFTERLIRQLTAHDWFSPARDRRLNIPSYSF